VVSKEWISVKHLSLVLFTSTCLSLAMTKHEVAQHGIRSNPPANMSVKEASIYIGVSERKLRESLAMGDVRQVRFGSRIILRKQDLDLFLEGLLV